MSKCKIKKISKGFTTVQNNVIKALKGDLALLGFYTYILHLPDDWEFYRTQLKATLGIGINRLDRYIAQLSAANLIKIEQVRNVKGQFSHIDILVYDDFNIENNSLQNNAQPIHENRETVADTRLWEATKEEKTKEDKTKQDQDLYCAPSGARSRFDDFWSAYPRKKDKARARQVWQKNGLDGIADKIINRVDQQARLDRQWKNVQYIPHPATYLRNERWEDDIELESIKNQNTGKSLSPGRAAAAKIYREMREGELQ